MKEWSERKLTADDEEVVESEEATEAAEETAQEAAREKGVETAWVRGTQPGQLRWDAGGGRRSHHTGLPSPGSARNGSQVGSARVPVLVQVPPAGPSV